MLNNLLRNSNRRSSQKRGVRWWVLIVFGAYAAYYWLSNQQEAAFTGRNQLIASAVEQEQRLGLQAYTQILAQSKVLAADAPLSAQVRSIAERLILVAPDLERAIAEQRGVQASARWDSFAWEINVLDAQEANAFCLPGGKMAIYTGILPIAKNADGLAVILGHEIAHALLRHAGERMAQQRLVQMGGAAAGMAVGDMPAQQQQLIMAVLGAGSQYGVLLPFSRQHETEADEVGLLLAAAACFDPAEAPKLWARMQQKNAAAPAQWQSSHPSNQARIAHLQSIQKSAAKLAKQFCPG